MKYEIIGIGSALVDVTIHTEDDFLIEQGLPKGAMTLVDEERSKELLNKFSEDSRKLSPGGAAANVIASYARCGGKAAFIGKTGQDWLGNLFKTETEKSKVDFIQLTAEDKHTGMVLTFITPDGQRTFATYLGASVDLNPQEINDELIYQAPVIHIEAYLVFNKVLLEKVIDVAKANNMKISIDLSSYNVVKDNLDYFKTLVKEHVDIIFANEDESKVFTHLKPEQALDEIKQNCDITVVKEGARGSWIAKDSEKVFVPANEVYAIDTNGAGDCYAGGVLFGLSKQLDIENAAKIGTKAGGLCVSQVGARLNHENHQTLFDYAQSFLKEKQLC